MLLSCIVYVSEGWCRYAGRAGATPLVRWGEVGRKRGRGIRSSIVLPLNITNDRSTGDEWEARGEAWEQRGPIRCVRAVAARRDRPFDTVDTRPFAHETI